MAKTTDSASAITGEQLIHLLNGDLAREYQALIAYTVYSRVHEGAAFAGIAQELEAHAQEELAHALQLAKQIDALGGRPGVTPRAIITSPDPLVMLTANLKNKREMLLRYQQRLLQAEAREEYPLSNTLYAIICEEHRQELHLSRVLGRYAPTQESRADRSRKHS